MPRHQTIPSTKFTSRHKHVHGTMLTSQLSTTILSTHQCLSIHPTGGDKPYLHMHREQGTRNRERWRLWEAIQGYTSLVNLVVHERICGRVGTGDNTSQIKPNQCEVQWTHPNNKALHNSKGCRTPCKHTEIEQRCSFWRTIDFPCSLDF